MADFNRYYDGRLEVVEWLRDGVPQHNKNRGSVLAEGDVLFVSATPDEIASVESEPGLALHAVKKYGEDSAREFDESQQLVQVVVAPHSPFIGDTIAAVDFRKTFDVVVVGIWRRQAWIRDRMSQVQLKEGDLLVLRGTPDRFAELAAHHGFLMMVPFSGRPRRRQHARRALLIVAAVVLAAGSGLVPAQMAFLGGAVALVLTCCVSVDHAYREIDVRIFVMIAGVIPLGLGMEKTGTAAFLAQQLQECDVRLEPVRRDARALLGRGARHADPLRRGDHRAARADLARPCPRARAAAAAVHRLHGARRGDRVPDADRPPREPADPESRASTRSAISSASACRSRSASAW